MGFIPLELGLLKAKHNEKEGFINLELSNLYLDLKGFECI